MPSRPSQRMRWDECSIQSHGRENRRNSLTVNGINAVDVVAAWRSKLADMAREARIDRMIHRRHEVQRLAWCSSRQVSALRFGRIPRLPLPSRDTRPGSRVAGTTDEDVVAFADTLHPIATLEVPCRSRLSRRGWVR